MGPVDSQKPPGLKSFPQQSQASSPLPVGSPSLEQFLRSDPFLKTKQEGLSRGRVVRRPLPQLLPRGETVGT